jgi:hypothetical protein
MIAAGTAYSFGLYSGDVKKIMGYTQPQIDTLALASSMGNYASFNSGMDLYPQHHIVPLKIVACVARICV